MPHKLIMLHNLHVFECVRWIFESYPLAIPQATLRQCWVLGPGVSMGADDKSRGHQSIVIAPLRKDIDEIHQGSSGWKATNAKKLMSWKCECFTNSSFLSDVHRILIIYGRASDHLWQCLQIDQRPENAAGDCTGRWNQAVYASLALSTTWFQDPFAASGDHYRTPRTLCLETGHPKLTCAKNWSIKRGDTESPRNFMKLQPWLARPMDLTWISASPSSPFTVHPRKVSAIPQRVQWQQEIFFVWKSVWKPGYGLKYAPKKYYIYIYTI